MAFSNKQLQVLKFGYTKHDAVICDGAVRSGKTSVLGLAYVLWAMATFNECNFTISGKTVSSAIRNIIKPLLAIRYLHDNFGVKWSSSEGLLTLSRGNKVNYFYVFGGSDESSYMKIQGITSAGAFLDEVALMPRSFVEQTLARCSVEGAKFWFSCNPEGPTHWFYQEWILKAELKNALYIHFEMRDNPSLSESVIQRYMNMYTGVFFDRYIRGLWVKAEGIIYRKFADNNKRFILSEVPEDIVFLSVGVDFGGNKSATTFVCWGFTRNMRLAVVLEAQRHPEELSPEMLDNKFVAFCDMVYAKYGKAFNSRCDNAEPVLIRGLKNAVLRNGCHTSVLLAMKKPINSRIQLITKLQGLDRFRVMEWCTTVIDALNTAVWDEKHPDERLDDGVTCDIDTLDAMEYGIEPYMKDLI